MVLAILVIYGLALVLILLYSLMQMNLVINYIRAGKRKNAGTGGGHNNLGGELPKVTIQLPVYNEMYVVERLLDTVAKLEYPGKKLEIQVLDDSTDETAELATAKVEELQAKGLNIHYIHRTNREGFKAGALEEGMKRASGDFIAIFDADFIPQSSFLLDTIPYFDDPVVGMVQTRWGHVNRDYSLLTRLQAFGLDAHFSVEQQGRNQGGHFINFNGTAGVWRKTCIIDAGGWEHDTLTEDLDLSYRAQLKGWKFRYLEEVSTPAELPVVMSAVKNQQFRWTKGGAENFRKMLRRIIGSKSIPLKTKIHGFFHLMNSSIFVCVLLTALFSVPLIFIKYYHPEYNAAFNLSSIFLVCTFFLMIFYWYSFQDKKSGFILNFARFFKTFVLFLATTMGLSLHNTVAVFEGYMGKKSSFVRTPKFNLLSSTDSWTENKYLIRSIGIVTILEGLLTFYFLFGIISAFVLKEYGLLPFHMMLFWGFSFVFINSLKKH